MYSVKVSILVVTYNHEKFIREALDSIIMQEHDYSYEIVIADDSSTDGTLQIIEEYSDKYTNFTIIPREENLGITQNYKRGFKACKGEYIAVLEGDDYWTSPYKISKMVEFLEENRGCALAFNRFVVSDTSKRKFNIQPWPVHEKFQLITVSDLIQDNMIGNFSTCVYRNSIINNIDPSLYEIKVYDWMFNIVNAQFGLIGYIPEVMSVYRLHSGGTWTRKTEEEQIQEMINSMDIYNKYLDFVYDSDFVAHQERLVNRLDALKPTNMSTKQKLKRVIKDITPPVIISLVKYILPPKLLSYFKN